MDTDEIKEEIQHQRKLQKEYRKRLCVLEQQKAKFGRLNVIKHIRNEAGKLRERIHSCELKIRDQKLILISQKRRQIAETQKIIDGLQTTIAAMKPHNVVYPTQYLITERNLYSQLDNHKKFTEDVQQEISEIEDL